MRPPATFTGAMLPDVERDTFGTVIAITGKTCRVQLAGGDVISGIDVSDAYVGKMVRMRHVGGTYSSTGGASGGSGGSVSGVGAGTGTGPSTGAPSPHDLLGVHHTLPSLAANLVLASPYAASGTPSFRALGLIDLPSMTIGAGDGLTGGGDVRSSPTLNVGVANTGAVGLTVEANAVRLTTSSSPGAAAAVLASDANGFLTLPQFIATTKVRTPLLDTASGAITLTPATGVVLTDGKTISGSGTFASGFTGSGWRIDQNVSYASQSTAEFDNLVVRGLLRVYELVINKIRVSRGSMIVSPGGGKVRSVTSLGGSSYSVDFEDSHGLVANDLLRAQKFTGSGTYQSLMTVASVTDSDTVTATLNSGSAPAAGYEYAVIGNTSNTSRQGGLFLTADDSGAPFMDVYDGVAAHADFNTNGKTKARLGRLTGITDPFFGTLDGHGLWTNRAWLNGAFINGSLVIGPGLGFTLAPLMYCGYDTPRQGNVVNANGHKGQAPSITGGVHGMAGKYGGAVAVGEGTTNRIQNPSVETNTTGYGSSGTVTLSRSTDYALFGQYSLKWVRTSGTADVFYNVTGTLSTSATYTFSVYARRSDGAAVSGVTMYIDSSLGTITPTITNVGNGWYRIYGTRTIGGSLGNHIVGIAGLATGVNWYFDGWQVEARGFTTPYTDGSLGSGYTWTGTPHASTSTRTAAVLAYPILRNINPLKGSVSAWVLMEYYKTGTGAVIWNAGDASGEFVGQISTGGAAQLYINGNQVTHQTAMSAGWHHVVYTWDIAANEMRVYLDGVASTTVGTPTTTPPTLHASTLQVGGSAPIGTSYNWNGLIDDFAILDKVLTAEEVRAIFSSDAPLNVSRSNFELVLAEEGYGRTVANAAGIYGTDVAGKPTFSLVNADATVNGELMTAGDTLLGDNSTSPAKGNVLFDQDAGKLKIRSGTTEILSFGASGVIEGVLNLGTSGEIRQGSGTVGTNFTGLRIRRSGNDGWIELFDNNAYTLSLTPSNALTIVGGTAFEGKRAVNYVDSAGTRLGELYGYSDGSTYNAMRLRSYSNSSSRPPYMYFESALEAASGTATTQLIASNFTSPASYPYPTAMVTGTANIATPQATVTLFVRSKTSGSSGATATLTDNNGTTSFVVTAGTKSWRIDHPLTPTTHWLDHVAVEGDGHYTFYRGNVTLDQHGLATVQMPEWFDALNDDLAITYGEWGDAPRARTSHRIKNGWVIAGQPHQRVSWMASGVRADAWAKAHPVLVEVEKDEAEQGTVFTWQEHGLDESFAPPAPSARDA